MEPLSQVTAAVLAGGRGTRLRPAVADRPKVLAEVGGRPFVIHLLEWLAGAGVRRVVLCTGYRGSQMRDTLGGVCGPLRLLYSEESTPLGTAGALRHALPVLSSESVLVLNGDSWCDVDLAAYWAWYHDRAADGALVLAAVDDVRPFGHVTLADDARVLRFAEKDTASGPGWINAGIYLFRRTMLESIPAGRVVSLEREMLPAWSERRIYGYRTDRSFLDIGTPERYAAAKRLFATEVGA